MPLLGPEFLAGMLSGAGTRFFIAPFDIVKIRLQLHQAGETSPGTILATIRQLYSEEGIKTFWRGNMAATMLYVTYGGVQFGVYNAVKPYVTTGHKDMTTVRRSTEHFVQGALASLTATLVTYPFDWARTRFAAQGIPRDHKTTLSMMKHGIRKYGPFIVFDGVLPTLIATVPSMAITFATYERLRVLITNLSKHESDKEISAWVNGVSGALAGLLAKLITYPLDTVKKRLQTTRMDRPNYLGRATYYSSFGNCFGTMLRDEGWRGFYRGFTPSLIKVVPSTSISFVLYELTLQLLST